MIQYLEKFFEMTSKPASLFIGLEITRKRDEKKIFISQPNYIRSLLHKFKMTDCNPSSVPADPGSRLTVMDCPLRSGTTPLSLTPYRSAVGGLMYAAKMTRPDILFAVTAASRYNQNPGNAHWAAVKRILSYLAGTINHGLCFGETDSVDHLVAYSDSDFAGCQDTRRSNSGLLFTFNGVQPPKTHRELNCRSRILCSRACFQRNSLAEEPTKGNRLRTIRSYTPFV